MQLEQTDDTTRIDDIDTGAALIGTTSVDISFIDDSDADEFDAITAELAQAGAVLDGIDCGAVASCAGAEIAGGIWAARSAIRRAHAAVRQFRP